MIGTRLGNWVIDKELGRGAMGRVYLARRTPAESDKPGFGIDLDEKLAAKFPIQDDPPFDMRWGNYRRLDGTIVKP